MLNPDGTKRCPRCGLTKLAGGSFYKSGASADGFAGYCKQCTSEKSVEWHKALPADRRSSKNKADWERFKSLPSEEKLARNRKRYEASKRWINASPENKAKQREWQLAYKLRDPEKRRLMNQIHNNRQRAKKLGLPSTFQYVDWLRVLEVFAHRCAFCGAEKALLEVEHLDALTAGGPNTPANVVPACRPCNAQKWRKTLEQFCAERGIDPVAVRAKMAAVAESL